MSTSVAIYALYDVRSMWLDVVDSPPCPLAPRRPRARKPPVMFTPTRAVLTLSRSMSRSTAAQMLWEVTEAQLIGEDENGRTVSRTVEALHGAFSHLFDVPPWLGTFAYNVTAHPPTSWS